MHETTTEPIIGPELIVATGPGRIRGLRDGGILHVLSVPAAELPEDVRH